MARDTRAVDRIAAKHQRYAAKARGKARTKREE